jgi:hypothetical protein
VLVELFQLKTRSQQLFAAAAVTSDPSVGFVQVYVYWSCDLSYAENSGLPSMFVVNLDAAARLKGTSGVAERTTGNLSLWVKILKTL